MWNTLAHTIKDVARDSLGVVSESARTHSTHRESWWFSEEVQTKVAAKQSRFKELLSCREGNLKGIDSATERYKLAKREAKIAVARAKDKAYEDLYKKLDSKEGANDIYKIAKARERRRRDLGNVRYIKDEGGRTIVREEDIRKRWGEYFYSLFNESSPEGREVGSASPHLPQDCYYSRINQREVRIALQKMGRNKVVGPDQIPIEAWKCLKDEGVKWLTCLFNKIFSSAKMPDEWRLSEVIPIYKNKGDVQGVREPIRFYAREVHNRGISPSPKPYGERTLIDKGTPRRYLRVIKDMYDGAKTRVRSSMGNTMFFPVEVGLHQGSAISPYLFALILDELSRGIQENIPWSMVFADDIVLVAESADGLNIRLESWRRALEDNGLRVSRDKTEYLRCDFGRYKAAHGEEEIIRIGDQILQPKESFRYLGSVIHRSGRIDEDITHRIRTRWMRWRATSGVLCDKRVPLKVEMTELRMLRWTCGKTMLDMIPNGVFRAKLEVESIIYKMREGRLRWFGHVKKRPQTAPVRRVEALFVDGLRRRGRPKLRWEDGLKQDMKELLLSEDMTSDRNKKRKMHPDMYSDQPMNINSRCSQRLVSIKETQSTLLTRKLNIQDYSDSSSTKSQSDVENEGRSFWYELMTHFKNKSKAILVSYYFNVYLLRRRAHQNRTDPSNVDSDDDELEKVEGSILCSPKELLSDLCWGCSSLLKTKPNLFLVDYSDSSSTESRSDVENEGYFLFYQAEIPEWTPKTYKCETKWLGTRVWPLEETVKRRSQIERERIVKGRQSSCGCEFEDSLECVRFHISEKRYKVRLELGPAFANWKFDTMGEEVLLNWTMHEEKKFAKLIKLNPESSGRSFWYELMTHFKNKSKAILVSYYFNVYLLRRRAHQNRTDPSNVDSDDDELEKVEGSILCSPKVHLKFA
ncbi:retrovirus-related pol polyprotein LINE-1 [Tanacetum coccineum]